MPQDFGIVLKGMLVFGPLAIFSNIGFSEFLIRIKDPNKKHYDTVLTANIILSIGVALALNIIAPIMALVLHEDTLRTILPILSLKVIIYGFINPRIQDLLKEFQYAKDFQYLVYSKLIHIVSVVSCCFYFRNYYGLIVGQTLGELGLVFCSYYIIHYKPAFSLKYIKDCIDFSLPNMRAGVGDYILMNIDRLLLLRFLTNKILGFYSLAYELAEQFITEIIYPLARAFFPVFADLENDSERLKKTYLQGISFLIPLCLGVGIGLSFVAKKLIFIYAGAKWEYTGDLLQLLALSSASQAFCLVNASVLGATGRIKIRAKLTMSNAIISAISMLPFAIQGDIIDVILVKVAVSFCFVFINLYVVFKSLNIPLNQIFSLSIRPTIASFGMVCVLLNISISNHYLELFSMIVIGCISYIALLFILWFLSGKPQSIEYSVLKYFKMAQ
jgi:PST family polysaccharide transporter